MKIHHVCVVIATLIPLSIHGQAPDLPNDVQNRPYCAACIEVVRPMCTLTLVRRRREDPSAITLPLMTPEEVLSSESVDENTTPDIKLKTVSTPECDDVQTTEPYPEFHSSTAPRLLPTEAQTPYAGHPHCYEFLSVSYRRLCSAIGAQELCYAFKDNKPHADQLVKDDRATPTKLCETLEMC
ncbi:hypothetical protein Ddc_13073 [Ditylenchus destructor]|nr:hypothetical protein Ddc_13073 [Ditylenchus destructor]